MRLWHIDLIPYLPKSQLLAQWRELNSIFKKQDKHILINYVYNDYDAFMNYCFDIMSEFRKRKYIIKNYDNFEKFFGDNIYRTTKYGYDKNFKEHDNEYLTICYWNLREKYIRGQKDFTDDVWNKLDEFYKSKMGC